MAQSQIQVSNLRKTVNADDGTVSAPSITFLNDTNTGLYRPANDTLSLVTNGTECLKANPNGDIQLPYRLRVQQQPSFRAYYGGNTIDISTPNTILPYNEIAHNIGNGYNKTTYKFTVPISGVYYFYASTYTVTGNQQMWDILYDGAVYERAEIRFDPGTNSINKASTIINCTAGKDVWVQTTSSGQGTTRLIGAGNFFITFCGHMLS